MTAKVYEFSRSIVSNSDRENQNTSTPKTNREIFQTVSDTVLSDWQQAAVKNRLSDFIWHKLPPSAQGRLGTDYANDLNAIAIIEQKLDLKIALFSPGSTKNNPYGWLAAFQRDDEIFTTPADIVSEANARALNVVLFVSFDYTMRATERDNTKN